MVSVRLSVCFVGQSDSAEQQRLRGQRMSSPIDSFAIITINAAVTDLQNIKINYSRFRQEAVLLSMDSVINRFFNEII